MQEVSGYERCLEEGHIDGGWWAKDAQGIPLCKVCERCEAERLSVYRPEILRGYDQSDVDEPIEEEG